MKAVLCIFLVTTCYSVVYGQTEPLAKYIKISGGGIGDSPGYFIAVEGSGNFIQKNEYCSKHLQLGGEIYFQNGASNPEVENPDPRNFSQTFFYHESLVGLNGKVNFFPFQKKLLKGLNISIGVGAAYYTSSKEGRAVLEEYDINVSRRMSELRFENKALMGYRISVGYDIFIIKKFLLAGVRYDISNYNNGDYYYVLGGKIGFAF
ncbi:MAG: hypothetical protein ACTHMM_00055 [Agriterribacter sp.]